MSQAIDDDLSDWELPLDRPETVWVAYLPGAPHCACSGSTRTKATEQARQFGKGGQEWSQMELVGWRVEEVPG